MGITYQEANMLYQARSRGVSFADTLTVAHLALYLHPREIKSFRRAYQTDFPRSDFAPFKNYKFGDYSDEFLREFLGAAALTVLDYSSYEGADLVHDLNLPVAENLWERFDAVIDAGSLEHIFSFPTAVANLMKMVKTGGSIFISAPANNLCGHGFYQFSPELMFRIFSEENGFNLKRVALWEAAFPSVELTPGRKIYEVRDPAEVQRRVGLMTRRPVMMMVEAQKKQNLPLFARPPLQYDYTLLWDKTIPSPAGGVLKTALKKFFARLPLGLQARINGYREKQNFSFSNRRFFKKL